MQAARALEVLRICSFSPEPSLLVDVISRGILCTVFVNITLLSLTSAFDVPNTYLCMRSAKALANLHIYVQTRQSLQSAYAMMFANAICG